MDLYNGLTKMNQKMTIHDLLWDIWFILQMLHGVSHVLVIILLLVICKEMFIVSDLVNKVPIRLCKILFISREQIAKLYNKLYYIVDYICICMFHVIEVSVLIVRQSFQ